MSAPEGMTPERARALREPFPESSIGKLPKAGMQLDYVGHAAVTDRLLAIDPEWSWEPFALDDRGLPALDSKGNLWIKLTICGVTRIGVGDGQSAKIVIGDAIRNAAMRFGVALDLWSKEELEGAADSVVKLDEPLRRAEPPAEPADVSTAQEAITAAQMKSLQTHASKLGLDRDQRLAGICTIVGRKVESSKELTKDEATKVIKSLAQSVAAREAEANA